MHVRTTHLFEARQYGVQVMASELSARLKQAIDASNVRHFEDDVQERLALHKAPGGGAAVTVADVLQVTYAVSGPLASLMPERVMVRYEQVSTFLLKLKTMEFQLQQAWQVRRGLCWACTYGGTALSGTVLGSVFCAFWRWLLTALTGFVGLWHSVAGCWLTCGAACCGKKSDVTVYMTACTPGDCDHMCVLACSLCCQACMHPCDDGPWLSVLGAGTHTSVGVDMPVP